MKRFVINENGKWKWSDIYVKIYIERNSNSLKQIGKVIWLQEKKGGVELYHKGWKIMSKFKNRIVEITGKEHPGYEDCGLNSKSAKKQNLISLKNWQIIFWISRVQDYVCPIYLCMSK